MTGEQVAEEVDRVIIDVYGDDDLGWEVAIGDSDSEGEGVDPRDDFEYCWEMRRAPGGDAMESAFREVLDSPPTLEAFGEKLVARRYTALRFFLAFCQRLQERQGARPFFAPQAAFAAVLDTSPNQVHRWLYQGRREGFLEQVYEGSRGRAAEYFFHDPAMKPS